MGANPTGEVVEDATLAEVEEEEEEEVEETKTGEEVVEGHAPECHHFLQLNAGVQLLTMMRMIATYIYGALRIMPFCS